MNTKALFASLALLCILSNSLAQTTPTLPPPPVPQQQDKDDVVRITTNLVQVDAVVTKNGKQVTDLKAEDFEIFEDGKRQTITSFAYISNVPATIASTTSTTPAKADKEASVPSVPLRPNDPRRTLAIVVDDLGLSAESMSQVRKQLRKFVNEQMQPHDLVAIIRTGTDIGALQQFTNDKRLLSRAVEQLRWNIRSRVGIHVLAPAHPSFNFAAGTSFHGRSYGSTLGSVRTILKSMAELPGRKSMMILSDHMPTETQDVLFTAGQSVPSFSETVSRTEALHKVAEMAIRSSVVIYSIDTQGLQTAGITAADQFGGRVYDMTQQMNSVLANRSRTVWDRRGGGDMISRQTGGFQVRNSNDYKLDRVLEDQNGYYLIGYRPTDETFNRQFHRITAKVKRSGTTLRTRYGFYGYSEEDEVKRPLRPQSKLLMAVMSPFEAQDIDLEFTSFFANDKAAGSVIRSFLYLNAKDLTFAKVNDKHEAGIQLEGVIFGDNGIPVDQLRHAVLVSLNDAQYELALRDGIRIRFDMPAKRPGAYQVRVAARDVPSSRIGAAGEFVAVPDLKNKQLAVSGIVLQGIADAVASDIAGAPVASPAIRRFRLNSDLFYGLVVYNALVEAASGQANLTIEARLFHEGKRVVAYPETPVEVANQADAERIFVSRVVRLDGDLEPGHYYLQVLITDKSGKKDRPPMTMQWVDFEIVK